MAHQSRSQKVYVVRMPTPLSWPDCRNVRDIGGLPIVAGGQTRTGALIRSDSLDRLTADGVAIVRAASVRRILDLRGLEESREVAHPFASDTAIYRLVPLIDPAREPSATRPPNAPWATSTQPASTATHGPLWRVWSAIADAPPGVSWCIARWARTALA